MAADINTQLQNISTDVTAIGNLVNRLTTIFSAGGVQNPDLATMKAELQTWTTTQLGNYVSLTGNQDIVGAKKIKNNSLYFETTGSHRANITINDTGVDQTQSFSGVNGFSIYYNDINNTGICAFLMRKMSNSNYISLGCSNNNEASCALQFTLLDNEATGIVDVYKASFIPYDDAVQNLGIGSARWAQVYASNSSITTSDERVKESIQEIPDSFFEAWEECGFYQFKFKDAVKEKGLEQARVHIGCIAQRVKNALLAKNITPEKYGFFCHDAWEDEYEDVEQKIPPVIERVKVMDLPEFKDGEEIEKFHYEDKEVVPEKIIITKKLKKSAGDLFSLRYEELLCIEAAYLRWKNKKLETRLAALEAKVR